MENQDNKEPRNLGDVSSSSEAQDQGASDGRGKPEFSPQSGQGDGQGPSPAREEAGSEGASQEAGLPETPLRIGTATCSPEYVAALQEYDFNSDRPVPQPAELGEFPRGDDFARLGRF